MTLDDFITKWQGKPCDFDNFYGAQCSDLAQQYNKELYNGPFLTGEAAADLWETYPVDFYERVLNTPEAVPAKGDLIIWRKTTALPWGHVAIFVEGDVNRFTSFDQNWPTGSAPHIQEHSYTGVIGWLHPIKNIITDYDKTLADEFRKLQAFNSFYETGDRVIQDLTKASQVEQALREDIRQKDTLLANLNQQINDRNNDIVQLQAKGSTLEAQLLGATEKLNIASEQALLVPSLKEQVAHLEEQKTLWVAKEQNYVQQIKALAKPIKYGWISAVIESLKTLDAKLP